MSTRDRQAKRRSEQEDAATVARLAVATLGYAKARADADAEKSRCINDVTYPFGRARFTMDYSEAVEALAPEGWTAP